LQTGLHPGRAGSRQGIIITSQAIWPKCWKGDHLTDDVILETGQPANALYFLISGNVLYYYIVTTDNNPNYRKEYFIDDISPGEIFGISALIEPYQYTATIRVDKSCRVIRIDANALRDLCREDDALCKGFLTAVAKASMERLENTRVRLVAAQS